VKRVAVAALAIAACCPTPPRAASPSIATRPPPVEPGPTQPTPPPAPPPLDWSAAGVDWTAPPPADPEVAFAPPVPTELRLSNGARCCGREPSPAAGQRADRDRVGRGPQRWRLLGWPR
jgi:hypothetical protein